MTFFDTETTSADTRTAHIVSIAAVRIVDGRATAFKSWLVKPPIPIPEAASEVHGIRDADVADAPPFEKVAAEIVDFLSEGVDEEGHIVLGGFNVVRFDVPVLAAEMHRAGIAFPPDDVRLVDPMVVYHNHNPRNLAAAVRRYLGREHVEAHDAMADAVAAAEVFLAQKIEHDLPESSWDLNLISERGRVRADIFNHFEWVGGKLVYSFGKYNGTPVGEELGGRHDTGYHQFIRRTLPERSLNVFNEYLSSL